MYGLQLLGKCGLSILLETPVLLAGLSPVHSWRRRIFAGIWLTACSYPVVVLVIPFLISPENSRTAYLLAAETFAPASECLLFWFAFDRPERRPARVVCRDCLVIVAANLFSFGTGEILRLILSRTA